MANMHRSLALLGAAALALTAGGCGEGAVVGGQADAGKVSETIKADEKAWNADFKARNLERLIGHYADDAYFVAPGAPPASGRTEIRRTYANALSDKTFEISFGSDKTDVARSGDLAYSRGQFSVKYTDPDTRQLVSENGSYIAVYKKQEDGSWKVVEDFTAVDSTSRKTTSTKPAQRAKMVSF